MNFLNVAGCTIEHADLSIIESGVFIITTLPDTKINVNGSDVYFGIVTGTFTGGSTTGGGTGATGTFTFTGNSTKIKLKDTTKFALLENIEGTLKGSYLQGSTTVTFSSKIIITNANQNKVKGV